MTYQQKADAADRRRRHPSRAEKILWQELKERKLGGFRFVREAEILGWWADFYCAAGRLIVEVDGKEHGDQRFMMRRVTSYIQALKIQEFHLWII